MLEQTLSSRYFIIIKTVIIFTNYKLIGCFTCIRKRECSSIEYLNAIPHKAWATYAFPYPRFGHLTSNLSESINSAWKDLRHFPILKMVDTIWSTMMKTIYKRYHEP